MLSEGSFDVGLVKEMMMMLKNEMKPNSSNQLKKVGKERAMRSANFAAELARLKEYTIL